MIALDRLELLKAIVFIKAAISESEDSNVYNCLHVRQEQDRVIFTGGNGTLTKKAILVRPSQLTLEQATKEQGRGNDGNSDRFMIPLSTLVAFELLVKKHKEKAKKLSENDQAHLCVDISKSCLESFGVQIEYKQPAFKFHDFESEFQLQSSQPAGLFATHLKSKDIDAAITGFEGSKPVEITFLGESAPIHFMQDDYRLEALLNQTEASEAKEED